MQGKDAAGMNLRPLGIVPTNSFFQLLVEARADVNHMYPEESHKDEKGYKCTSMINMVRHNLLEIETMRRNLHCLMDCGAKL